MNLRLLFPFAVLSTIAAFSVAQKPRYTVPSGIEQLPMPPDYLRDAPELMAPNALPDRVKLPLPPTESPLAASVKSPIEPTPIESTQVDTVTYSWTRPWNWIPWTGWKNSFEFGLNGSEGNAQSNSLVVGTRLRRQTEVDSFGLDLMHRRTRANSIDTQNNAFFGMDYDYKLGTSPWTVFFKEGLEFDKFKAFDSRLNLNSGLGYYWIRNDLTNLITRFGSGTSREFGGPDNEWKPEAVLAVETNHQVNKRNKVYGKIEYFPQWDDFAKYRMVNDVGWEVLVDESNNLSFKIGATNRYDSTPQGRKPSDLNYSVLLLYKF